MNIKIAELDLSFTELNDLEEHLSNYIDEHGAGTLEGLGLGVLTARYKVTVEVVVNEPV